MAVIDLVKWNAAPGAIAWKCESEELSTWTQLIVSESQEAFLVRGGVYEGPFGAGRHTLSTENIPLLTKLIGLPFGGKSPFTAEVWFLDRTTKLDLKWGTQDPIQIVDPKYKVLLPVRAFGQYGIQVKDSKKFLIKVVGTLKSFDEGTLSDYFRGVFATRIKNEIATVIAHGGTSVFEISTKLASLSEELLTSLSTATDEYGIRLSQFNVNSVSVPEDDAAVVSLKRALSKKAEMGIVGFDYQQERSFDVLESAAKNEGSAGTVMSAGIGLGLGASIAAPLGKGIGQAAENLRTTSVGAEPNIPITYENRLRLLKELSDLRASGVLTEQEFQSEKQKLLGS